MLVNGPEMNLDHNLNLLKTRPHNPEKENIILSYLFNADN